MNKTYRINLDIGSKEPQRTNIVICAGDKGITFDIGISGVDTANATAKVVFKKNDGNVVEAPLVKSGTRYIYTTLGNETSYPGVVVADVKLTEPNQRVSTTKFIFEVDQDTINGTPLESDAYSTSLEEAISMALEAADSANEAADNATHGLDGFSPIVSVSKSGKVTTISITDKTSTKTATINDGQDGTGTGDMKKSVYDPNNRNQDIFAALDAKAIKAKNYTATLLASGWAGTTAPYTQTVTVTGITSTDEPFSDVVLSSALATAIEEELAYSYISKITTGSGTITATCNKTKPTVNINLKLKVVG